MIPDKNIKGIFFTSNKGALAGAGGGRARSRDGKTFCLTTEDQEEGGPTWLLGQHIPKPGSNHWANSLSCPHQMSLFLEWLED